MADVPGDLTTSATIAVGTTITNEIETLGDHDWYKVTLTAGQKVTIALNLGTLEDSYLYLRDASGNVIAENDDGGGGRGSRLVFTAPAAGTYYIDASAWVNDGTDPDYTGKGTYTLSVSDYVMPSVGTLDEIAYQMTHGFFDGNFHHFDVTQGGTITVDLDELTPAGRTVALQALQQWTDIIGVNFVEQSEGAQITFDDLDQGTGAFANAIHSNHITTSAIVNVATYRINLHTYMHEIGHALGLGHTSNSNAGTAASVYPDDALWSNDGAAVSIMSYFDNGENGYYANLGFSNVAIKTPQVADIIAIGNLYGLSTTTRLGNTTYGFNNNSGRTAFDATINPNVAYTIFDSGGIDTLDYSGFPSNQLINLNPEAFSNVGASVGNVVIARGTVIENAIGGSGHDQLIGNGVANVLSGRGGSDTLQGGGGHDVFRDSAAGLDGDIITDFSVGDRIVITDADISNFWLDVSGPTVTFANGSFNLAGFQGDHLTFSAAFGGGVQLTILKHAVANDFDGDGRSDILWRDGAGTLSQWLAQPNGSFVWNPASIYQSPSSWQLVATGDFNSDGRDDILWRDGAGALSEWLGQMNGSFAWNPSAIYSTPTSWQLVATGDFNYDGRDDILWRDGTGTLSQWLGQMDGSFAWNPSAIYSTPTSWQLAGTGDFNFDGRDDILWRDSAGTLSQWLGQSDGSFAWNASAVYAVPLSTQLAGIGDFNADGRDDVLWRDSAGTLSEWLAQSNGSFAWNPSAVYSTPAGWQIAQIGNFNEDAREDILWRDSGGTLSEWLGQANGSFAWNAEAMYQVPGSWQMQPPHDLM